jgi:peptide/nickel transport system ATP-binding protein
LREVSLDVPARRHVALVGESGCGKSVTMRAIMGILPTTAKATSGEILFEGRDLVTLREREREALRGSAMSMVFQDPMTSLNPVFTIGDQMGTILKYADRRLGRVRNGRGRMVRVHEVLRQVRMPDPERIAGSYPIMLSGGMRQRVLIAMALLSEPRLLVADEPGTALDVTTQAQILKLLKDLVEERDLALLMITHNLGVVRESADYVYVMYAGSVVEHGPTADLFAHPSHPYTRALIDCVPKLSGDTTFRGIDGSLPDYAAPPPGCRFSPRCGLATDVCERPPADTEVGAGHGAACWHLGEAAA